MIGNSSDESVENEGIVIEEMIIGMITTEMDHMQKGRKLFLPRRRRSMKMCPVKFGPHESLRQRMRMRIYAVR